MTTSTGVIMVDKKATVPGISEVWFDPDGPTNLLSYGHMEDRFKIMRDNKACTFQLHTKAGPLKFKRRNHLYVHRPSDKYVRNIAELKKKEEAKKPRTLALRPPTPTPIGVNGFTMHYVYDCEDDDDDEYYDSLQEFRYPPRARALS